MCSSVEPCFNVSVWAPDFCPVSPVTVKVTLPCLAWEAKWTP